MRIDTKKKRGKRIRDDKNEGKGTYKEQIKKRDKLDEEKENKSSERIIGK